MFKTLCIPDFRRIKTPVKKLRDNNEVKDEWGRGQIKKEIERKTRHIPRVFISGDERARADRNGV